MAQTAPRRLQFVAMLGFALAMVGCKEGTTFSPSDPATVRERILEELNASPNLRTQAIAAGVTREVTFIRGGNPNETGELWRFLMDWTSDANHVTIAIYQTALDSRGLDTGCRVPGSLGATPAVSSHLSRCRQQHHSGEAKGLAAERRPGGALGVVVGRDKQWPGQ